MGTEKTSVEALLDVLGNETRRAILRLLAEEPSYLLQLSKELGVTAPGLQKHLKLLGKAGLVESFWRESDAGGPRRRYFQLSSSLLLTSSIGEGLVRFEARPVQMVDAEENGEELRPVAEALGKLKHIGDLTLRLQQSGRLLAGIDRLIQALDKRRASLLALRERAQREANEAIRKVSEAGLKRKILYKVLSGEMPAETELFSVRFGIRERTVEEAISELRGEGLLPAAAKAETRSRASQAHGLESGKG